MSSLATLRSVAVAALIATPLLPATAATDTTPNDQSRVISGIDTNHDGTVSLDEAKAAALKKFDALDTDKEGTLDVSELTGILSPEAVKKADRDKDLTLDKAEFLALVEVMFRLADHDHDGTLTAEELSSEQGRALVALLAY